MGLDGGADSTGGADRTDDEWRNADDGDEPRVDVVRVPFQASAQVSPNQIAVPASLTKPTRDYSCRPLGSAGCAWIPIQTTHSSTEGVVICRSSALRGLNKT